MSEDMESGPGRANLTAEDLSTVYEKLHDARTKWHEIGMLLKVDKDTLQCIDSETESQDHHSKCLRKMLTHHLEAVQCPLTWELLCDCLRANTVSRYDVAEKIEQWLRGMASTSSREESFVNSASVTPHKTSDSSFQCPFGVCTTNEAVLPMEFHSLNLLQGESLSMLDSDLDKLKDYLCDPQTPRTLTVEQSVIEDDILDLKDKTGLLHNTLRKVLSTVPGITHFLADYLQPDDDVSNSSFNELYSKVKNSFCTKENVDVFKQIYDNVDINDKDNLKKAQRAFCAYDQSLRTMLLRRIRAFPGGWKYGQLGDGDKKLRIKYETASLKINTRTLKSVQKTLKSILKIHSDVHIRLILTREGCMEVLFALFTVPMKKGEELLPEELSLQQKRDLARHSISLLEYNSRVLYCCCMLTGDQESEGLLKDLLRKRKEYHSASLKGDHLRNHHPDCPSLKDSVDVKDCPIITCSTTCNIQKCGIKYHARLCKSTLTQAKPNLQRMLTSLTDIGQECGDKRQEFDDSELERGDSGQGCDIGQECGDIGQEFDNIVLIQDSEVNEELPIMESGDEASRLHVFVGSNMVVASSLGLSTLTHLPKNPKVIELENEVTRQVAAINQMKLQYDHKVQQLETQLQLKMKEVEELQQLTKRKASMEHPPSYPMDKNPHGVALVIVNGKYDKNPLNPELDLSDWQGAQHDQRLFRESFTTLNYIVESHTNLTSVEMLSLIAKAGGQDHSNHDSFVLCLSTHSVTEGLYGSDSVLVPWQKFYSLIKQSPTLQGKPKLCFFQSGPKPLKASSAQPSSLLPPHKDSDIFEVFASTPNNESYTSPQYGSWLASAMHRHFTNPQLMYTHNLEMLMNYVCEEVQLQVELMVKGDSTAYVQQCVEIENTLTKAVYFFPPQ